MQSFIIIVFSLFFNPFSQVVIDNPVEEEVEAINGYVSFVNESVHGMLIVHRLLENYNQDINKYVDLDGFKLNFYTNSDLPQNIFHDPDKWFYEESPEMKFPNLGKIESELPEQLQSLYKNGSGKIRKIYNQVNDLRFEIEVYIKGHDLSNKDELYGVYELLEKAVILYDDFFAIQASMEKGLEKYYAGIEMIAQKSEKGKIYQNFRSVQNASSAMLNSLRTQSDSEFISSYDQFILGSKEIKSLVPEELRSLGIPDFPLVAISAKLDQLEASAANFKNKVAVPKEYSLYGRYYFYHNSDLINKLNKYGNGFINEMNLVVPKLNPSFPLLFEVPHYFRVIYPKRIISEDYTQSSTDVIFEIPTSIGDRTISTSEQTIKTDGELLELQLFDHMMKDGDIVSVNFNGDWIFKNLSLEHEPKKVKLKLNQSGKNFLIIHSENLGIVHPNTTGVTYRVGNRKEDIILQTDLNTSALIELEVN